MWASWGYSPAAFWKTHPREWWWVLDTKLEKLNNSPSRDYAGMSLAQVAEIYEEAYG